MRRRRRNDDDAVISCLIWIVFILVAMPLYGAYRILTAKTDEDKLVGGLLLVVGIVLWIVVAVRR